MDKFFAGYIFGVAVTATLASFEVKNAYETGLKNGERIGRIGGVSELAASIRDKWRDLNEADVADSSWWLNAVTDSIEAFTDKETAKRET